MFSTLIARSGFKDHGNRRDIILNRKLMQSQIHISTTDHFQQTKLVSSDELKRLIYSVSNPINWNWNQNFLFIIHQL